MISSCCGCTALILLVISCCDLTTSYRCTRLLKQRRTQSSPLQAISHDSTDFQRGSEHLSESLQFLEKETARVFQLYMKSRTDMRFHQKVDAIKDANDCHIEQHLMKEPSLGYFDGNEGDYNLRDVIAAEDKASYEKHYEKHFALQAKEKIGALSRRIESKPPTTYLVPPKPTTPPVVFSTPYSLPSYVKVGNVCEIDPVLGI